MMLSRTEAGGRFPDDVLRPRLLVADVPTLLQENVAPPAIFDRICLRSSIVAGVAFVRTLYCLSPIFAVPEGRVLFLALTALTMSSA